MHTGVGQSIVHGEEIPHALRTLIRSIRIIHLEPFYTKPFWKKWETQDNWKTKDFLLVLN